MTCQHCGGPKKAWQEKFCSNACYNAVRQRPEKDCPVCGVRFRPNQGKQKTCSASCGAVQGFRPAHVTALAKARAVKAERYKQRLAERLRGMTAGAIWRLAYTRGYNAAVARMRKGIAA